jgi:hypothetical protein
MASSSLKNMNSSNACPTNTDLGWYLNLDANERITGKLSLFNEIIYASRYLPNRGQICSPGTSSLSEHSMTCGKTTRKTSLGSGIATGAVVFNNMVYVGISTVGGAVTEDVKDEQGVVVGKKVNNLIVITPKGTGAIGNGKITQESWREIY